MLLAHPILSSEQAKDLEKRLFAEEAFAEWKAMEKAGSALARALLQDLEEYGPMPEQAQILVLVGKGHNGGDALLATSHLLAKHSKAEASVLFVFGERHLRENTRRAWNLLQESFTKRVSCIQAPEGREQGSYTLCIDGIFGFQFHHPLDARTREVLRWQAACDIAVRAAVDLPSGLDETDAFAADFTYATGSVKSLAVRLPNAGRLRYLDLGFFENEAPMGPLHESWVLTETILEPLRRPRKTYTDKRSYGHLFVLGGSRQYPGAVLMTVLAALRSGAGLVTAFVPESLVPAFAARAPEAIWVPWPETPLGSLALEGQRLLDYHPTRPSALVLGPGLGREPETQVLAASLVKSSTCPLVIDADALQFSVVRQGKAPRILTPHAGEYLRIAGGMELGAYVRETNAVVALKGPVTCIASGARLYHSFAGGPVLARGGSGDLLAGLIGGLLAQTPNEVEAAAARGVYWHGRAADCLARAKGQTAVQVTQLLDHLHEALHCSSR